MINGQNKYQKIEEVPVWQKAHGLTLEIYKITEKFPKSETFGIISQLRRASSSIPANITEGFYRKSTKELIQFLYNARGSYGETIYHLILAKDLKYLTEAEYRLLREDCEQIGKQLNGWIKSLRAKL